MLTDCSAWKTVWGHTVTSFLMRGLHRSSLTLPGVLEGQFPSSGTRSEALHCNKLAIVSLLAQGTGTALRATGDCVRPRPCEARRGTFRSSVFQFMCCFRGHSVAPAVAGVRIPAGSRGVRLRVHSCACLREHSVVFDSWWVRVGPLVGRAPGSSYGAGCPG